MTRRFFFGLIPAVIAAIAHPSDTLRRFARKVQTYRSFVVTNPHDTVLKFCGISESPLNEMMLCGKYFRIVDVKIARRSDRVAWDVTIEFEPIPRTIEIIDETHFITME